MAAASSSASFFEIRDQEDHQNNQIQQQSLTPSSSAATANGSQPAAASQKKKRNLPGNPNPDAEVIALSPKTLLATNRFVCEVCNKGFQREQNLQLHRRGHNLPWKLRQKSTKEVRRKVYLCPELTCVHHDPSRALGDLTGIKKHFCRKHGEKKWKCDKCSKRYAVQSDWKAHSKTCGTREYRCDCGTLFSRRDSFITHRAFCDALTQESTRLPTGLNAVGLFTNSNMGLGLSQVNPQLSSLQDQAPSAENLLRLGGSSGSSQFDHLIPQSNHNSSFARSPSSAFYLAGARSNHDFQEDPTKPFHGLMQLQNLQNNTAAASSTAANLFNLSFFSNSGGSTSTITNSSDINSQNAGFLIGADQFNNASASAEQMTLFAGNIMGDHGGVSSLYNASVHNETVLPHMSATALLQKAAQMGATTSCAGGGNGSSLLIRGFAGISKTESMRSQMENEANLQDLMNSLANGSTGIFGGSAGGGNEVESGFDGFNHDLTEMDDSKLHRNLSIGGGSDGLTRDFLGVGSVMRGVGGGLSQRKQHQMGSLYSELRSGSSGGRPFGGGNLQ